MDVRKWTCESKPAPPGPRPLGPGPQTPGKGTRMMPAVHRAPYVYLRNCTCNTFPFCSVSVHPTTIHLKRSQGGGAQCSPRSRADCGCIRRSVFSLNQIKPFVCRRGGRASAPAPVLMPRARRERQRPPVSAGPAPLNFQRSVIRSVLEARGGPERLARISPFGILARLSRRISFRRRVPPGDVPQLPQVSGRRLPQENPQQQPERPPAVAALSGAQRARRPRTRYRKSHLEGGRCRPPAQNSVLVLCRRRHNGVSHDFVDGCETSRVAARRFRVLTTEVQIKPPAPCIRERVQLSLPDYAVASGTTVISNSRPALRRRRGLKCDTIKWVDDYVWHGGELTRCTLEYKADVIMVQETLLKPRKSKACKISNYIRLRIDRIDASKGGTALYYNRSLYCCPIDIPPLVNIEATACTLSTTGHGVLTLVSVYLPPKKKLLRGDLGALFALGDAVLFGDLNSKSANWKCNYSDRNGFKTITNWQKISTVLEEIDILILNSIPSDIVLTDDIDSAIGVLTNHIKTVVDDISRVLSELRLQEAA
ncbi:hypothetical protein EVAR_38636_1 [Eumeta japonica]|uniref:RNA-directed DNA polymerase from mobile element jockey n=1 Tax=Eumeta variegata TaxID=151549 RepID=A0A4C1XYU9_EUMVA|nr:hypothetical protein EVAR_38636_1 [Eumeta japonica]